MTSWRPPIATAFTRDTAYPTHAERLHVGRFAKLPEALHLISWIIVHKGKLYVHYDESKVYFVGNYTSLGGKEAIDWLSHKIGKGFIDYAADLFVELYENRKAVCDTDPAPERQVMFFPNRRAYLYGIDFENQIIKIAYAKAVGMKVVSYPAEKALKILGIDWGVVRRSFGVAYLIKYNKQKLIDALNKLVKEDVIITIWGGVMQKPNGIIYHTRVVAASPNSIAFRVKLSINPHLKTLMLPCQIASHKGGVTIINLGEPDYKMLYIPAEQKVILHLMESKLPLELEVERGNLQVIWNHNSWLLLASWHTFRDSFDKLKVSAQSLSKQDFDKLIDTLELRLREG